MSDKTNIELIKDETFEDGTSEITFIVHGESHGICNALRHNLMKNPNVKYAVYNIDHPLTGEPEMTIKTNDKTTPRDALKEAAEELLNETNDLKNHFEKNI